MEKSLKDVMVRRVAGIGMFYHNLVGVKLRAFDYWVNGARGESIMVSEFEKKYVKEAFKCRRMGKNKNTNCGCKRGVDAV